MTRFSHKAHCLPILKLFLLVGIITTGGDSLVLTSSYGTRATGENNEEHLFEKNPCPEEEDISPCVCHSDNTTLAMTLDCSEVASEDELRRIFSKQFPYTNFTALTINFNKGITSLKEGDFGNASFNYIQIRFSALREIDDRALMGSWEALTELDLPGNKLEYIPDISNFTKMNFLDLSYTNLSQVPHLKSTTLQALLLTNNNISQLPLNALQELPNLFLLDLDHNPLKDIPSGTFTNYENLGNLYLNRCSLTTISKDAIRLHGNYTWLHLHGNQLSSIPSEALSGVTQTLDVSENELTELPEKDYRPVVEKAKLIYLYGNPFDCGCDIAWLVENQTLLNKVCDMKHNSMVPSCHNQTLFTDLDPEYYKENCHNSTEEF